MLVVADPGILVVDGEITAVRARRASLGAIQPYLYLASAILGVVIWIYWPIAQTARLSTIEWNLLPTNPQVPVGLDNHRDVLQLPQMRTALWNTLKYTLGLLPFSVVLPLGVALLLADLGGRRRGVYRVLVFLPVLMAPVVVGVVWRWMLHPTNGIVNAGLGRLGIAGPNWFRDENLALWTITGITGWKLVGFSTLIFAAGVAGLDPDAHDAARIDGATRWQSIRHVTIPLLSPTIMLMVLLTVRDMEHGMPPKKRRTGPGYPDHHGRTTGPSSTSAPHQSAARPGPSKRLVPQSPASSTRYTAPQRTVRIRPAWHKAIACVLLVLGVVSARLNDAMLLGGVPTWLLPGGHNEAYLMLGIAAAVSSTWWFGWFDRTR